MASGIAGHVSRKIGKPVHFGYWSEVFDHNPHINPGGLAIPGNNPHTPRPYSMGKRGNNMIWNPAYRAVPGEVYLQADEIKPASRCWVIEPNVKNTYSQNKDWGWERWQAVVDALRQKGFRFAQFQPPFLDNIEVLETRSFREALSYMQAAEGYLGPEGGLHHAAAAFRKPATVIFGGYIHPQVTGYDFHGNIGGDWCGAQEPCPHCRKSLDNISIEQVIGAFLTSANYRV